MDYTTTTAIENIQRILEFMQHTYPWITLLLLLATVLIVMMQEKRRRALRLERSEEEARIHSLPGLSEADREQLLMAAAPLPHSKEAYPLPDLPLRLTSALAKVFGLLKIVLLGGAAYVLTRIVRMPERELTAEHPVIFSLLIAGMILLSMLQIIASTRVTRGSNRARRFLIFMAVLELGTMMQYPGMAHAVLWRIIIGSMAAYMLWALLLRSRAQTAITHQAKPTPLWKKTAILVLCLLSFIQKPIHIEMNTTASNSYKEIELVSVIGGGGATLPIQQVILQAGDPSTETWHLMKHLDRTLQMPTVLIEFGKTVPHSMDVTDLYLLVSKSLDINKEQPPKTESNIPIEVLKLIGKESPEIAQIYTTQPSGDEEIAFEIATVLTRPTFLRTLFRDKIQKINDSDVRLNLSAEYSTGDRAEAIDEIGDSASERLNEYITERNRDPSVEELPDILAAVETESLPAPNLAFMTNAVFVARTYTPLAEINLYHLGKFEPECVGVVSNQRRLEI
jgi:hypothetical protein